MGCGECGLFETGCNMMKKAPCDKMIEANIEKRIAGREKVRRAARKRQEYRCQFCEHSFPIDDWLDDGQKCPGCGKSYNATLAQESEE